MTHTHTHTQTVNCMGKFQLCKHSQITILEQGSSFKFAKIRSALLCDPVELMKDFNPVPGLKFHTVFVRVDFEAETCHVYRAYV